MLLKNNNYNLKLINKNEYYKSGTNYNRFD